MDKKNKPSPSNPEGQEPKKQGEKESNHPSPEEKIVELTSTLKHVQADFENYRKQVEKRLEDMKKTAAKNILTDLLPVLDHFELALRHDEGQGFKQGVEMIHQQLVNTLLQSGLQPIEGEGETLDVERHEPIEKVASDKPKDTVVEVVQKGYLLNDKVLRVAKVKISSGQKEQPDKKEGKP